jgi:RING-box protein 1
MFKLLTLNMVSTSKTNCYNDGCSICKEDNDSYCVNCIASNNTNCSTVIGDCGHAYHEHCINEWLKLKRVCPLCNKVWHTKIKG